MRLRPSQSSRDKLISGKPKLSDFPWSSYQEYRKGPRVRSLWLRVNRLLGEHGMAKDSGPGREQRQRSI
jgi:hypothetical protein